jgi:hypothetical protein
MHCLADLFATSNLQVQQSKSGRVVTDHIEPVRWLQVNCESHVPSQVQVFFGLSFIALTSFGKPAKASTTVIYIPVIDDNLGCTQ